MFVNNFFEESPYCLYGVKLVCMYVVSRFGEFQRFLGHRLLRSSRSHLAPPFQILTSQPVSATGPSRVSDTRYPMILRLQLLVLLIAAWLFHMLLRRAHVYPKTNPSLFSLLEPLTTPFLGMLLLVATLNYTQTLNPCLFFINEQYKKRKKKKKKNKIISCLLASKPAKTPNKFLDFTTADDRPFSFRSFRFLPRPVHIYRCSWPTTLFLPLILCSLSHCFGIEFIFYPCLGVDFLFYPIELTVEIHRILLFFYHRYFWFACDLAVILIFFFFHFLCKVIVHGCQVATVAIQLITFLVPCESISIPYPLLPSQFFMSTNKSRQGNNGRGKGSQSHRGGGHGNSSGRGSGPGRGQATSKHALILGADMSDKQDAIWNIGAPLTSQLPPPPPVSMAVIPATTMKKPLHHYLQLFSNVTGNVDTWANAILIYNLAVQPQTFNFDLTRVRATVLLNAGINIDKAAAFAQTMESARNMLAKMQPGLCQTLGDLGSTGATFSRVFDLEGPQPVGHNPLEDASIPYHLNVSQTLSSRVTPDKGIEGVYSKYEAVPIYCARNDTMSSSSIMQAHNDTASWTLLATFVILHDELQPAIPVIIQLIQQLILESHHPQDHGTILRQLVIKTIRTNYDGDQQQLDKLKHLEKNANLAIYMFLDPEIEQHQRARDALLISLFNDVRATSAVASLLGIKGVFSKRIEGRAENRVNAGCIPRALLTASLHWVCFANLPAWVTADVLHIILVWSCKITDIILIFPHLDAFNTPQMSTETKLTPALMVSVAGAESMKRLVLSVQPFKQVLQNLVLSHIQEEVEMEDGSYEREERLADVQTPSINIKYGSKGPTASTTAIQPEIMTWETLKHLREGSCFPPAPDGDSASATAKRSHPSNQEDNAPALSIVARLQALDVLSHHLMHDTTADAMRAMLTRIAAVSPEDRYQSIMEEFVDECLRTGRGSDFRVVDTRLWTENPPQHAVADVVTTQPQAVSGPVSDSV